ncbi:MAG: 2-hydroxychromene-2-carboxylate isomerase [Rhodoferax sp.]|nr:2-hydroxychromene-2-carboxylate isomerase [Rhodoferax sp.]
MARNLEFLFDVGSPAAYLAWTQLPSLCAQTGASLTLRPLLLGGLFQATGNRAPIEVPAKGRYLFTDLARFAQRYRVPFRFNPHFPIQTLTLMRMATGLQLRQDPDLTRLCDLAFRAIWVDGLALGDASVLGATLQAGGFDADALMRRAAESAVKEALRTQTEQAVQRGVFGAPTFFVGDQMFWGQDRLDFVREALV